jgi:hypothetical protein
MTLLYFIPTDPDLTSTDAFRKAIQKNTALQRAYLDDLSEIYREQDEDWHEAFTHFHELLLEHEEVAIGLVSNGFWIDDLQFVPLHDNLAIKLIP